MELEIRNIKSWDAFTLTIGALEMRHVLLAGPSGSGKTTILDCIYFAICGVGLTSKWDVMHRHAEACVILRIGDITISRRLNPRGITVSIDSTGEEMTGDEAEAIISVRIVDQELFRYLGYVPQKSSMSHFVNASPKERALAMERVVFTGTDLNAIKAHIKAEIDKTRIECAALDMQQSRMGFCGDIEPRISAAEMKQSRAHTEYLASRRLQLADDASRGYILEGRLQQMKMDRVEAAKEVEQLAAKIKTLKEFCTQFDPPRAKSRYAGRIAAYEAAKPYRDAIAEYGNGVATPSMDIADQVAEQEIMMKLYGEYEILQRKMADMDYDSEKHADMVARYNGSYIVYDTCPNCDILLRANPERIEAVDGTESNPIATIAQFETLRKNVAEMETLKCRHALLQEAITDIESRLVYPIWTPTEYARYAAWSRVTIPPPDVRVMTDEEYKAMVADMSVYAKYMNIDIPSNVSRMENVQCKIDKLDLEMKRVRSELKALPSSRRMLADIEKQISEHQASYDKLKDTYEYQQVYYAYLRAKKMWDNWIDFQKCVNESCTEVIMHTLISVNVLVDKYMEGFFEMEEKRPSLNFYVNDKDQIDIAVERVCFIGPANLGTLSGGEYDRAILAVVLAFAEFYRLPILLLDELLGSLDESTFEQVVGHIQKCYPTEQAIVYIGHHINDGLFDRTINLE